MSMTAYAEQGVPDLAGEHYLVTLQRLHTMLEPKTYFEIGTLQGSSLAQARCASLAVDPGFQIAETNLNELLAKPEIHFYRMRSDDFFAKHSPSNILGGPVDLAFLDGMHRCEYLLRDFMNTERHCKSNSIIALHDCLPVEAALATRVPYAIRADAPHRKDWWAGDVWRTSLLLRRHRPDLHMSVLDCSPTGLVLITNLDPMSNILSDKYAGFVEAMMSWDLSDIGIGNLFSEMKVMPTTSLATSEDITGRFWL